MKIGYKYNHTLSYWHFSDIFDHFWTISSFFIIFRHFFPIFRFQFLPKVFPHVLVIVSYLIWYVINSIIPLPFDIFPPFFAIFDNFLTFLSFFYHFFKNLLSVSSKFFPTCISISLICIKICDKHNYTQSYCHFPAISSTFLTIFQ